MKIFAILLGSVAIACTFMAFLIWLAIFLDELNIHWTTPIDMISNHAEKTAINLKAKIKEKSDGDI